MKSTVLSKKQLAGMIDECINDLSKKDGSKLQVMGNTFRYLSNAAENDSLLVLAVPLANLGNHITWFSTSPLIYGLTPEARQRYDKLIADASKEAVDLVKRVKTELCVRRGERANELLKIVASLDKLWLRLFDEINLIVQAQPQQ